MTTTTGRDERVSSGAAVAIALLASGYVAVQILSDVSSVRLVDVFGKALDGGTFIYPITFTLRDLIHKVAGKRVARAVIVSAAAVNLFMAGLFWVLARMPGVVDGGTASETFGTVLAPVWRIVLASILAELLSEMLDTEVYSAWVRRFGETTQWGRVLVSNGVALPIDSVVFATIAFAGVVPSGVVWEIIWLNIAFKGVVTIASIPLIYTVRPRAVVAG
jgi:hypothetical protein